MTEASKELQAIHLLHDNPREILDEDLLGLRPWAEVVAGAAVANKGPFTIGIYLEWGYGKTTLLRLAKRLVDDSSGEETVTVWFNAWQFERESQPLFSLIAAITDEIDKKTKLGEEATEKLRSIGNSLRALTRGLKFKADVAMPLIGKVGVEFDADKALKAEELLGKEINPLQAELLYHSAFGLLEKSSAGDDGAKIVVFIDDLDRCNPKNAVRLLEGLKLVLSQKGFIFVLAVDNRIIEGYLDKIYVEKYGAEEPERGRFYMEKMVQLPIVIPPHEKRFGEYVERLIEELSRKYNPGEIKIGALRNVQNVLASGAHWNLRRLTRLINSFLLDTFLWQGTEMSRGEYKELDEDVANGLAIHRVVQEALGEEITAALILDKGLRRSILSGSLPGTHSAEAEELS